jgi:hypothetical protein
MIPWAEIIIVAILGIAALILVGKNKNNGRMA